MLLDRIRAALDWGDSAFDAPGEDGIETLGMPPGGIPVHSLDELATALRGSQELAQFLDPRTMAGADTPFQASVPHAGLFLTRFQVHAPRAPPDPQGSVIRPGAEQVMGLEWRGATWELMPGLLSMHDPGVTLGMSAPRDGAGDEFQATLFGTFRLAGAIDVVLYVSLERSGGATRPPVIFGNLAPGGPWLLQPLLTHLGIDLPGTEALAVDALSFLAEPESHLVSFEITLATDWAPDWGAGEFALTDVSFSVRRAGGVCTGTIAATATVFGQSIGVSIRNGGDGWWLWFRTDFAEPLQLGAALKELGSLFGLGDLLGQAPGFENLAIDSVEMEIGLEDHDLRLTITASAPWPSGCEGFVIEGLRFDIAHRGKPHGATTVAVSGTAQIEGVTFQASADYGGRNDGWTFTCTQDGPAPRAVTEPGAPGTLAIPAGLALGAADLPLDPADLRINHVAFRFNTLKKDFALAFSADLEIGAEQPLAMRLDARLTPLPAPQKGYEKWFSGQIGLGPMSFDLRFTGSTQGSSFVAAYQNHAGTLTSVHALAAALGAGDANPVPEGLGFVIRDAALVASRKRGAKGYDLLLVTEIEGGADLSGLPLVSGVMPKASALKLAFQPIYASRAFSGAEVEGFQGLLPPGAAAIASLPAGTGGAENTAGRGREIAAGFTLATRLHVGDTSHDLGLPLEAAAPTGTPAPDAPPACQLVEQDDGQKRVVKWINVQKALGPVHVDRIGVGFDPTDMQIQILLDASLGMGGLTLSLAGLGAGYGIRDRKLSFHLDGVGLSYTGGPATISGTFLQLGQDDFVGQAMLRTETLGLSALGAYRDANGYKSLFVYAYLDDPLGGPPFCFVEGLAAGFGYNRRVRDMAVEEVAAFPLVKDVTGSGDAHPPGLLPPASPGDAQAALMQQFRSLGSWIAPADGTHFLAVGLRFNTFRLVDTVAVAIASFGQRFRLDVLGVSTAVLPPRPPEGTPEGAPSRLASIEMQFKGRFDPDEGFLGIEADLTRNSWVLSKDCHLTGSFAHYSWFTGPHAGDFATTLGGYHRDFAVPDHYPKAKRLALAWHVCDQVEIEGNCYFALTPNAMMAGGHLKARWHCGDLWAAFTADADFLMQWEPFHYQASARIEVAFGYGAISSSIGASIALQGPEFSGTAHFEYLFVSFDVDFGAPREKPNPLTWDQFRAAFLPADAHDVATVAVRSGVIRSLDEAAPGNAAPRKRWVVNPRDFSLATSSLLPAREVAWDTEPAADGPAPRITAPVAGFGVAPMDRREVSASRHSIAIRRLVGRGAEGEEWVSVEHRFRMLPATKPFPAALWAATGADTDLDREAVLPLLGETVIEIRDPPLPGETCQIPRRNLDGDPSPVWIPDAPPEATWCVAYVDPVAARAPAQADTARIEAAARDPDRHAARAALIDALGLVGLTPVRLSDGFADDFTVAPRVVAGTMAG